MAKSQVVVFLDIVGLNPLGIPASHERLDKCFESVEMSGEPFLFFPNKEKPTHILKQKSVAAMFIHDTPQVLVPQGPVPKLARA